MGFFLEDIGNATLEIVLQPVSHAEFQMAKIHFGSGEFTGIEKCLGFWRRFFFQEWQVIKAVCGSWNGLTLWSFGRWAKAWIVCTVKALMDSGEFRHGFWWSGKVVKVDDIARAQKVEVVVGRREDEPG